MTDELQHYSAATNRLTSDRCHQMKYAVVIITPSGYIHSQCFLEVAEWPAPGSEDTELGVLMEPEVRHGAAEVYAGVQA